MSRIFKRGFEFVVDTNDWIETFYKHDYKTWEDETFSIIDTYAKDTWVFLDVGCWVGPLSIPYSQKFKHVLSIDADVESIKYIKSIINKNSIENITVINKAVYRNAGDQVIFGPNRVMKDSGVLNTSTSQIKPEETNKYDDKIYTVTLSDLMEECKKHGDNVFIKIDIEGGEYYILEDISKYCEKFPVYVSFHIDWWYMTPEECHKHLSEFITNTKFNNMNLDHSSLTKYIIDKPFCSVLFTPYQQV